MHAYINNIKNNKGFSLLEVIIAIAVLALLSGYVLQSFIVSQELNKRAADLDTATYKCVSIIERFKADHETILDSDYQRTGDTSWQMSSFYSQDWQNCLESQSPAFIITSIINKASSGIYTIDVTVNKKTNDDEKPYYQLQRQKVYTGKRRWIR